MGVLLLMKKLGFIYLLVSVSSFSLSLTGRPSPSVHKLVKTSEPVTHRHEDETSIHERLLRVNTNDYGNYSPPPKLDKPPFKLIPN